MDLPESMPLELGFHIEWKQEQAMFSTWLAPTPSMPVGDWDQDGWDEVVVTAKIAGIAKMG